MINKYWLIKSNLKLFDIVYFQKNLLFLPKLTQIGSLLCKSIPDFTTNFWFYTIKSINIVIIFSGFPLTLQKLFSPQHSNSTWHISFWKYIWTNMVCTFHIFHVEGFNLTCHHSRQEFEINYMPKVNTTILNKQMRSILWAYIPVHKNNKQYSTR